MRESFRFRSNQHRPLSPNTDWQRPSPEWGSSNDDWQQTHQLFDDSGTPLGSQNRPIDIDNLDQRDQDLLDAAKRKTGDRDEQIKYLATRKRQQERTAAQVLPNSFSISTSDSNSNKPKKKKGIMGFFRVSQLYYCSLYNSHHS